MTTIREAMSRKISPAQIEQQINHLAEDTARARRGFNSSFRNYSSEGNRDRWARGTARQRDRAAQITTLINLYGEAVADRAAKARAALLPTSSDPQAQIAGELAYRRIMDRPSVANADSKFEAARREIMAMEVGPVRTLCLSEMQARGELDAEALDALLAVSSPEYAAAAESAQLAQASQMILTRNLRQITEAIDHTPTDGSGQFAMQYAVPVASPNQAGKCEADVAYTLPTTIPMYDGPTVPDIAA